MSESQFLTAVKGLSIEADADGSIGYAENEYLIPEGETPPDVTFFIREGVTDAEVIAILTRLISFLASGAHRE